MQPQRISQFLLQIVHLIVLLSFIKIAFLSVFNFVYGQSMSNLHLQPYLTFDLYLLVLAGYHFISIAFIQMIILALFIANFSLKILLFHLFIYLKIILFITILLIVLKSFLYFYSIFQTIINPFKMTVPLHVFLVAHNQN